MAFALIFASIFVHASWNLLLKQMSAGTRVYGLIMPMSLVIYTIPLLLQWQLAPPTLTLAGVLALGLTGLFQFAYFDLLGRAYQAADMSLVYPIARGSAPVITLIGAVLLLGEPLRAAIVVSVSLMVAGVLLLVRTPRGQVAGIPPRAVLLALAVAGTIAAYSLWDKVIVSQLQLPPILVSWSQLLVQTLLLTPIIFRSRQNLGTLWHTHRGKLIAVAAMSPFSYLLTLYAMTLAPVSVLAPLREMSILVGMLFGIVFLHEPLTRLKLAGGGLMTLGMLALAFF